MYYETKQRDLEIAATHLSSVVFQLVPTLEGPDVLPLEFRADRAQVVLDVAQLVDHLAQARTACPGMDGLWFEQRRIVDPSRHLHIFRLCSQPAPNAVEGMDCLEWVRHPGQLRRRCLREVGEVSNYEP